MRIVFRPVASRASRTAKLQISDPFFPNLYARRNDAESINRGLVDSMYLGRAHSVGHVRQRVRPLVAVLPSVG